MRLRSGVAAVEFALTFGLLWLLLSGGFRLGYAIYLYQSLENAVAGAARFAARVDFDEPGHTFVAAVQNMGAYGAPIAGGVPLVVNLAPSNISVTWATDAKGMPVTLTIAVTGYSANTLFQTFTWSGKPRVTVRFAGAYKG